MPEPYFSDFFLWVHQNHFAERAPNGDPISSYGDIGDKPSNDLMSLRGVHLEFFGRLFVYWCMPHFNKYLSEPCRKAWHKISRSKEEFVPNRVLGITTVNVFAKLLEALMVVATLSAAVALVYIIGIMKYQLTVLVLFGFLLALEGAFISPGAIHHFALIAG